MKTDDFGLELLDEFAHRGIERRAVGGIEGSRGVEPQLFIISSKPLLPGGVARRTGIHRLVAEEIHVDRRRDALADDVDLLARLLHRKHRAWQRTQRSALCRRDHEVRIHHSRHRRQHDGELGLEKIDQSAVRPHGLLIQ